MIMMETPDVYDLLSAYCKAQCKWAVCVWLDYDLDRDTPDTFTSSIERDLPLWKDYWKTINEVAMTAINGDTVVFLCDTEEEMRGVYYKVRGQDGLPGDPQWVHLGMDPRQGLGAPTVLPEPGKFYACTYNPQGELLTENT